MECNPFRSVEEKADVIPTETVEISIPTPVSTAIVANTEKNMVSIRYSYYQPWLGGTNCSSFVDGYCVSRMANGEKWEHYVEVAIACPPSWKFGERIRAFGTIWICKDRGGAIQYIDGVPWIDFLTAYPQVPFKTIIEVELLGVN